MKKGEGNENYVDGTKCVEKPWSDKDFEMEEEYQEGPTNYTGGGDNEKHS